VLDVTPRRGTAAVADADANVAQLAISADVMQGEPVRELTEGETVAIPAPLIDKGEIVFRARGEELRDVGIEDGDLLVIELRTKGRAATGELVYELLVALGADPSDDGLRETPARVARAYMEMLTPEPFDLTTFPNDERYDELVVVRSIPFYSLCMHHLLPFHGVAHIAYLPGERIVGLSKLARVVDFYARDLQVQERLTVQIADWLQEHLAPKGIGVVIEAEHLCMSLRGVGKPGTSTVTSALRGLVRDDARTRQEFLSLTTRKGT